jgi:ADP-heptose:LPS heptosyltransferase
MKKIEVFLKNILLKVLLSLSSPKRGRNKDNLNNFKSVLFIRLNRIGDALVSTPLLHFVKENTGCRIFLLADKKNYFAFNNNLDIDKVIIFNKGLMGIYDIIKLIREYDIDTIVDLHDDVSTTVSFIVALSRAKNKFALKKDNELIYTKTIERPNRSNVHVVDRLLELGKLFNLNPDKKQMNIHYYPKKESFEMADSFLQNRFDSNKFLLGINISAGSQARFWGINNYRLLLNFLKNYTINCLLLAKPEDFSLANEIIDEERFIFTSDFDKFCALISRLNFLFTPDTSTVHIAAAFNIPLFGIYVNYNTDEMIWTPYNTPYEAVITREPTLHNIKFNEVERKLKPFLDKIFNNYAKKS